MSFNSSFGTLSDSRTFQVKDNFLNIQSHQMEINDNEWDDDLDEVVFDQCALVATQLCAQEGINFKEKNAEKMSFNNVLSNCQNESTLFGEKFNDFKNVNLKVTSAEGNNLSRNKMYSAISFKRVKKSTSYVKQNVACVADKSGEHKAELDKLQKEKLQLEEEISLKNGEVSLLRSELKRKEVLLDTERKEYVSTVEMAEKRFKAKFGSVIKESETKVKELENVVEQLKGEMIFKEREFEELTAKCKLLQMQNPQLRFAQVVAKPSPKKSILDLSQSDTKNSLKEIDWNFASRFDFGKSIGSKDAQVQTDYKERKRKKLRTDASQRAYCLNKQIPLVAENVLGSSGKATEFNLLKGSIISSQLVTLLTPLTISDLQNLSDKINDQKKLLEEIVHFCAEELIRVSHTLKDDSSCINENWYRKNVEPFLQAMQILIASGLYNSSRFKQIPLLESLTILMSKVNGSLLSDDYKLKFLKTVIPVFKKDTLNSARVLEVIDSLCLLLSGQLTDVGISGVLSALCSLSLSESFANEVCKCTESNQGICFASMTCIFIQKNEFTCINLLNISNALLEWAAVLLRVKPKWICSNGNCVSSLASTVHSTIYQVISGVLPEQDLHEELWVCLRKYLLVFHTWTLRASLYFDQLLHLPSYFVIMQYIACHNKKICNEKLIGEIVCHFHDVEVEYFNQLRPCDS